MKVQWFKVHSKARSRLSLTHLPVQPLSRIKSLDGLRVHVISPVVKEKVYGEKDLLKSQVLSSEWMKWMKWRGWQRTHWDGEEPSNLLN